MIRQVTQEEAEAILAHLEAVRVGHFIGTSGRHLAGYVSKDVPIRFPRHQRRLAEGITWLVKDVPVDVVVAPPMGALCLGAAVAEELGCEYAFLEEVYEEAKLHDQPTSLDRPFLVKADRLVFKRPTFQEAVRDRHVGIVEDVFTSGKTTLQTIAAVRAAGGIVVWVTGLYNRGGITAESLGVDLFRPLVTRQLGDWSEGACDLCEQLVPINLSPGHGTGYQSAHPNYVGGYV